MNEFNRTGATLPVICILHADPPLRAGLQTLLGAAPEWSVGCDSGRLVEADLVLADHAGAVALLTSPYAQPPVLVVTGLDREWDVRRALDAGVRGYVLQSCAVEELLYAVRQVLAGRPYLGEALREQAVSSCTRVALTRRETDVLRLLGEGNCNKLIARELDIGLGTVKTHVKNLMSKLGANARTQAVVLAAQRGLITPGALPARAARVRPTAAASPAWADR